ncbi:BRO-N domain-containing protein [Pseudomonas sediminis]|uniref:Phage antirepressor protein n=1 Tax=Pseudomonas sediminis TaxID=1691904 RepID=A0ABX6SFK9_9PSED|nr:BRO family protein [Pseudomonas sediminis]QNG99504.1 phage antirepressor protein [Pseudomonas sediminis]
MSQVQKFNFGLMDLRVIELDGQPWFVAADVLYALGLPMNAHGNAILRLDDGESSLCRIQTGKRSQRVVSESGLYKLVMRSDKPEAKAFQDWVTRVVLPAIRKDGAYVLGEEKVATGEMDEDELVLKAMGIMQRKLERLTQEKAALQADNQRLLPAAEVGQAVGQRSRIGVVEFARKLEGVNTMQVQKDLMVMQYLFKRDGHWAVRHKFKGVLFDEVLAPDGRSKIVVLEKGQQLLVNLYHDGRLTMKTGFKPLARIDLEIPHPRLTKESYTGLEN